MADNPSIRFLHESDEYRQARDELLQHAEDADGAQVPLLNVFVRRDAKIHHSYTSEMLWAPNEPGQDGRHVDMVWPLWHLLDLTPEGRGATFHPKLAYDK